MNQFLSNKITAGIVALALLVGVGVLISSGDTSSTTRNAALVVATPCTKPGQVTKVSKQSVVCATTNTGSLWYATMKAKGKAQACKSPGAIRKKSNIVWVCGVVKKKKLWQATQPLSALAAKGDLPSTTPATPEAPVVADNAVLADTKIPDDKIVTQVIDDVTPSTPSTTVQETRGGDVTAPVLVSTTATSPIDTSSSSQLVTIDMNITDDLSGVKSVLIYLNGPLGNSIVNGNATKVSGTALNGMYQLKVTAPKKSPKGDLVIEVVVWDLAGNQLKVGNAATVKQTGEGDVTAPVLVSTTATSPIDTSSSSQLVTIDMNITDDLSGVKSVLIYLNGPLGQIIETGNATKVSGTALNGMYQLKVTAPKKSPQGDLVIEVVVWDLAGNMSRNDRAATVKQTGA